MANHCVDVVCATCGIAYCALACKPSRHHQPDVMKEVINQFLKSRTIPLFRYASLICRYCHAKTVYEQRWDVMEAYKQAVIKKSETCSPNS